MAWQGGGNNQGPWGMPPSGGGGGPKRPGGGGQMPPGGPDLEALLKKFQQQMGNFTPGSGKDGKKGILLGVVVVVLLWLSSGIYIVKPDEQGVVMRFGEYHRTTASGLNFHLPYPIEKRLVRSVTSINKVEVGFRSGMSRGKNGESLIPEESLMLTGDENIVDINFEVQWKIADAAKFLFEIRNPEATVKAVAESAMREVIGKSKLATVLTTGREDVAMATKALMQQTLDEFNAGIEVIAVNLRDANPPSQVIDAFLDVQSARVDMETARNQAEAYRNDIVPRARGEAQKLVLDAEAYKNQVVARAQGEASRFAAVYNEYKQARDVTKKRMYLETMEEILPGMNKVIMDKNATGGVVPYMPLPELKAKQGAKP